MKPTRTTTLKLLRLTTIALSILIIVFYAVWRSLDYARGPQIEIFWPLDGSTATTTIVTVIGRADRTNSLSLNGQDISVDQQGRFTETVIVFPGMNMLRLSATDQFGRTTSTVLDIVGIEALVAPINSSPTRPATTDTSSTTQQ